MKLGIAHKLFLALFLAISLAVVSTALIMEWNLNRGVVKLVNSMESDTLPRLASQLEEYYRASASWDSIRQDPMEWRKLLDASFPDAMMYADKMSPPPPPPLPGNDSMLKPPPPGRSGDTARQPFLPQPIVHQFGRRLFLLDADRNVIIGRADSVNKNVGLITLFNQGVAIGYLGIHPQTKIMNHPQRNFLKDQQNAFIIISGMVILLSAGLSFLLAKRLVRPLKNITGATDALAQGDYSVRVPVGSADELGRLATDFNALALAMENNEQARRRWVADISHELRTPLTFLRSQVEAILDGVRQPTPEVMQAVHHEILRFTRLIDDLYQLSQSDVGALTYRKTNVELSGIISKALKLIQPEFSAKNIELEFETVEEKNIVHGDPERLLQLIGNLLENSLKYTDPNGTLKIALWRDSSTITIDFQDSAPGVPEAELGKLFDRLYRVDSSRNRSTGGTGLGLSICRNIVEAHEGEIEALTSPLGGVWIRLKLQTGKGAA